MRARTKLPPATTDSLRGNRLYRNEGDGTFREVEGAAGAGDTGYGMGVAVGDFDADGDPDLYVHQLRSQRPVSQRQWRVCRCYRKSWRGGSALEYQCPVLRLR